VQDGPEKGAETGAAEGSAEVVEVVGRFEGKKPFAAAVKELVDILKL